MNLILILTLFQELYGKVRSLLNKLTPQNFKTLMGQLKSFELNSEVRLNKALDIIYEAVISDVKFQVIIDFCKYRIGYKAAC